ncbi:MAG: N-acetylglucosamine kinase [Fimbriimonadaceae bacterium]
MPTFLGIDCGGSTTRTYLIDSDGNVLHRGQSGPGNLASTPQVEIERHIREALAGSPAPDYTCGCFAGLLTDADRQRAHSLISNILPETSVSAFPDFHATLAAEPNTDLIIIAGTGALIASKTPEGVTKSAGGGPLLGDHGSAFDLGRRALNKLILNPLPPSASPMFWDTVVELFGSKEPNQILAAIYRSVSPAARVAKLAPVIVMDAQRGLDYARQSVDQALSTLAHGTWQHIQAHLHKLPEESEVPTGHSNDGVDAENKPIQAKLAGGLWEIDDGVLIQEFKSHLQNLEPRNQQRTLTVEKLSTEPVIGATNIARDMAKIKEQL